MGDAEGISRRDGIGLVGLVRTRVVADALSVRVVIVQAADLAAALMDTHHGGLLYPFFPQFLTRFPSYFPSTYEERDSGKYEKLVKHMSR